MFADLCNKKNSQTCPCRFKDMTKLFLLLVIIAAACAVCPTECDCVKKRVDCGSQGLQEIPRNLPKGTTHLELQGNNIGVISKEDLQGLHKLIYLDLGGNEIDSIDGDAFVSTPLLSILILRKNNLNSFPDVGALEGLTKLDLRANNITQISKSDVHLMARIDIVDLSRNRISHWEENNIHLSSDSRNLHKLDLSLNLFTDLPDHAFSAFYGLVGLKLHKNLLRAIPRGLFSGTKLNNLDLSRNNIQFIDALAFSDLPQLQNLSLARNQISRMTDGVFFGCDRLKSLNLSHNQLESISGGWLFGLQSLETLDVSSNKIGWFDPTVWEHASTLKVLDISSNRLRSLPSAAFRKLSQLTHLNMADNTIEFLHKTAMTGLDRLKSLDLSSNTLAFCVEDGAVLYNTSLPYLKELRFKNNSLRVLPTRAFDRFPGLDILDLRENPIATMHSNAFEPLLLKTLFLNTSSLLCDCKLDWWTPWLISSKLNRSTIEAKCSHPTPFDGFDVFVIHIANLTCVDDSPRARVLLHPPAHVKTLVGDGARFTCSGYGHSPVFLEWRVAEGGKPRILHEDQTTKMNLNRTITMNSTRGSQEMVVAELTLDDLTLMDSAEYQCIVRNRFGTDYSHRAKLEVQQGPSFTLEPDDVALLVGQNARIPCAATGVPQPVIKWQKEGNTFPAASERRLHVRPNDDHLYVMSVRKEDAGVYTCIATNDAGIQAASATLNVYDNVFRHRLTDVRLTEGEAMVLDCTVDVREGQHLKWIKSDMVVTPSPRITLKAQQQLLIIVKVVLSDSGIYICQLWAGAHLLTEQSANVKIDPSSSESSEPFYLSSLDSQFNENDIRKMTFFLLFGILLIFIIIGISWILIYWRRANMRHSSRSNIYTAVIAENN